MIICRGVVFSIGFVLLFKALLYKKLVVKQAYHFSVVPLLAVTAIVLWGMQGYVGLSTARTLNMYSNVITEKSRSNHYLINTNKTKIWDYEEDLVTIVKLPEGVDWDESLPVNHYDVPLIEFKRLAKKWALQSDSKKTCTIIYKNKRIFIPDLKNSAFSKTEWWHRFLFYKMIPKEGANPCMW